MQTPSRDRCGIIVLAAGNSSRLGKPKQLLEYQDKSLIRHILDEAIAVAGRNVIVVLGADSKSIEQELSGTDVKIVKNPDWKKGIASSIRTGLSEMLSFQPLIDGMILTVCDQPYVSAEVFNELLTLKENTDKKIVASTYENTVGTPALFGKKYFPALMRLEGDEGAKKILMQHQEDMLTVSFPLGGIDIDTTEDYNRLSKQ